MLGLLLIVFAIGALIMLPTMGGGGRRQVQSRQQAQILSLIHI